MYDDVDPAERFFRTSEQGIHGGFVGNIAAPGDGLSARGPDLPDGFLGALPVPAVMREDRQTFGGQAQSHGPTDATGCAGDDRTAGWLFFHNISYMDKLYTCHDMS